jgi:hypothetical protein
MGVRIRETNSATRNDAPVIDHHFLVLILEVPFWCAMAIVQTMRESAIIQKWFNFCLDLLIYIIQRILQDPIINECIATTIASGINVFIQQPGLDKLLLHVATSLSKTQPDIARQQGQDFPMIVSSFVQGIIHAVKSNNTNTQNKSNKTTDISQQHPQLPIRSSKQQQKLDLLQDNDTSSIVELESNNIVDAQEAIKIENTAGQFSKTSQQLDDTIVATSISSNLGLAKNTETYTSFPSVNLENNAIIADAAP